MFDAKSRHSFDSLGRTGGWCDDFMRMTGNGPSNFPFVLVANKADPDLVLTRQVSEDDVHDWCINQRGLMPFLETSLVGDPYRTNKCAMQVLQAAALAVVGARVDHGQYRPPDTIHFGGEYQPSHETAVKTPNAARFSLAAVAAEALDAFKRPIQPPSYETAYDETAVETPNAAPFSLAVVAAEALDSFKRFVGREFV